MNPQMFTQKSLEILQIVHDYALDNHNSQIEPEHLLYALLSQENGLIPQLLHKIGVDNNLVLNEVKHKISLLPKISGSDDITAKIFMSNEFDIILNLSKKIAEKMKDEYVSVEHMMISIIEKPTRNIKEILVMY